MDATNEIRVGVRELRADLTRYLKAARDGATVIVTSRNRVVAELRAPSPERLPPRRPGGLEDKIWVAEDFDTWPEDIFRSSKSGNIEASARHPRRFWWLGDFPKIRNASRDVISEPDSTVFVSLVSLLEIVAKVRTGKLRAGLADIERLLDRNRFIQLAISTIHLAELERLPTHHHDPSDHRPIAQGISAGATLVSADRAMRLYPVRIL